MFMGKKNINVNRTKKQKKKKKTIKSITTGNCCATPFGAVCESLKYFSVR